MSPEEKRAYHRGYQNGAARGWPLHRPPAPPDPVAALLVQALADLADGVDGELAKLDPEDEWTATLGPLVDRARAALAAFGEYVTTGATT